MRIHCCRTQTRCLRGAPRCRRVGESGNVHTLPQNEPYPVDTNPHAHIYVYVTRGAVPGYHRPHIQTIRSFVTSFSSVQLLSRAPAVPFIRLTPRGQEHPAELHHSGTMMPRHNLGNPKYGTADIQRPVSTHCIHQTAPLFGARYDRFQTTITNAR